MDGERFDSWTRRRVGTVAGGVLATLLLGTATSIPVDAKKKGKKGGKKKGGKKKCGSGQKLCDAQCIPQADCCNDSDCNRCAREICQGGVCGCHPNLIRSNGVCGSFISCSSVGQIVSNAFECCSDEAFPDDIGQLRCLSGKFNCNVSLDCADKGPCRGFMCSDLYNSLVGGGC
jgi:hypothetical protein